MRLALASALFLLLVSAVGAQPGGGYTVTGRVLDAETEAPIPLASVALWRVPAEAGAEAALETGGVTDEAGRFEVVGVRRGRYYAVVSFLGYASARVDSLRLGPEAPGADLGTLRLRPDAAALVAVEVTAARDRVEVQVDRTVYHIADDPLASGGSTSEALETIPSVEVDVDGNVSLRGASNVVILIDGRPAPVGRDVVGVYLQSLPAEAVERVEVVPNPSAAYEPDGSGGLINIVLKEDTDLGVGGAVTVGGTSQAGYNATGLLTWGTGPLRLSGTYGLRSDERVSDGDRFRINRFLSASPDLDQSVFSLDQDLLSTRRRTSNLLSLSADYAVAPRTTLTASAQATLRGSAQDERTDYLARDGADLPTADYVRRTVGDGGGWSGGLRLGLRQDFEGQSTEVAGGRGGGRGMGRGRRGGGSSVSLGTHALAVDLRLNASGSDDNESVTEVGTAEPGRALQTERNTRDDAEQSASLQVDYALPLGQTRLEAGYQGEWEARESDFVSDTLYAATGQFVNDALASNAYDYDEQVHAVYLQLARQVGPVGVQAGVRGELARSQFVFGTDPFDHDYASLFPSAALALNVTPSTVLKANYSRRINRPRGRQLNPFPSTDDPQNIRVGNPELRPEYTNAVELGVVQRVPWGSVSLTPYLRYTTDVVRRFQTVDANGVTTSTYRNLDTQTSAGVEAVLSYQTSGPLRGFASLEGYRLSTDGTSVESGLGADAFGWGGRLNGSYSVGDRFGWGDLDLQGTLFYRAPQTDEQGRVSARVFVDLALRQRLLDGRASLALRARDPFGLSGFQFVQDDARLYQEFTRSAGRREVGVTFTYTFGNTDRRERDRDGMADGEPTGGDGGLDY